jgi:hypothetical protein
MPKAKTDEAPKHVDVQKESVLNPYTVILDGQDRVIFAKDEDDLQSKIASLRA